jgi:hypothetical protein
MKNQLSFEIAPKEYHKKMTLSEIELYCWSLVIDGTKGWRVPTHREALLIGQSSRCTTWHVADLTDPFYTATDMYNIIPVRDR